jgi:hypothetical protein
VLGRAYFVEDKPESENPLPQAYVEVQHSPGITLQSKQACMPILSSREDEINLATILTVAKSY